MASVYSGIADSFKNLVFHINLPNTKFLTHTTEHSSVQNEHNFILPSRQVM